MTQRIEYVSPHAIQFVNELDLPGVEDPQDQDVLVLWYDEIVVIPGGYDDQIDFAERIRTTVKNQTGRDGRAVRTGEPLTPATIRQHPHFALLRNAYDLLGDGAGGEWDRNPEYTRAIFELTADTAGLGNREDNAVEIERLIREAGTLDSD